MATLRELRRRIKAVQNIERVTSAMRMVASARLRQAQERVLNARPYAQTLERLIAQLLRSEGEYAHPFLRGADDIIEEQAEEPAEGRLLIALTGDRGLCGAFNANIVREAMAAEGAQIAAVGSRGADMLTRRGANVASSRGGIFRELRYAHAQEIAAEAAAAFTEGRVGAVDILYNEFRSALVQETRTKRLLPAAGAADEEEAAEEFLYEPSQKAILDQLLPKQLETQVWQALLESNAAEQAARMTAMENATKNAKDKIEELRKERNRARQAIITQEIAEIVGGAEALKSS